MSAGHEGSGFVPRRFVVGQFATTDALLEGTKQVRARGHKNLDTHTPYPVHGLEEAIGLKRAKIPTIVLMGAIAGAFIAYSLIYYCNVFDWPMNVGNRPPHGPPANIPITFELAVLIGGTSSFFGFFALAGLPKPYHPIFQSETFASASIDGFFLSVEVPAEVTPEKVADDVRGAGGTGVEIIEELER
ncbi:MAG TPA: DUF3341 domain-containing protein [Polyangia bacterium]|jgi:hypothetical protein|nr:DUF3341 domain-containing protein [Polyangia bacterium]